MNFLSVSKFQQRSKALGPGERCIIWFHGCSRNCPECIAKSMNESSEFELLEPIQLANRVLSVTDIEGITISGGEPFEQDLAGMYEFLEIIRKKSRLSIMLYSGYLLSELQKDPEKRVLLSLLDILVDGPYRPNLNDDSLWKGSSNQVIHFLTERYSSIAEDVVQKKGRSLEIQVSADMRLDLTGIPPADFRKKLEKAFRDKDLQIQW